MNLKTNQTLANDSNFSLSFISSLSNIQRKEWNGLIVDDDPFLCYEFLSALENNNCLGERFGWYPHHLIVKDLNNNLIAATPLYIKTNSYGEFVFDWSWASAYEQAGLQYYPKIISSIPYTPVTGNRLLFSKYLLSNQKDYLAERMIQATIQESKMLQMSGTHWLFNTTDELKYFNQQNVMFRMGCQFHWNNCEYESFDHYLEGFVSRKRKKIKQQRRYVAKQSLKIKRLPGTELSDEQWQQIHTLYESTFYKKSGIPTLSLEFFQEVGKVMGERIMLVLAYNEDYLVACAINFRSSKNLYGRFWGCNKTFHSLHFEVCYYQGIEYAIENKLQKFEPGAQGEHKISRGFLPTETWSVHAIHDARFEFAIRDFCKREQHYMKNDCLELMSLSPFRSSHTSD